MVMSRNKREGKFAGIHSKKLYRLGKFPISRLGYYCNHFRNPCRTLAWAVREIRKGAYD